MFRSDRSIASEALPTISRYIFLRFAFSCGIWRGRNPHPAQEAFSSSFSNRMDPRHLTVLWQVLTAASHVAARSSPCCSVGPVYGVVCPDSSQLCSATGEVCGFWATWLHWWLWSENHLQELITAHGMQSAKDCSSRKTSSFPSFRDRRSWSCGSANIMRPPGRKSPGPLGGENAVWRGIVHGREQNGRPPKGGNAVRHWTCPSPILVNCCLVPSDGLTVLLAMSRSPSRESLERMAVDKVLNHRKLEVVEPSFERPKWLTYIQEPCSLARHSSGYRVRMQGCKGYTFKGTCTTEVHRKNPTINQKNAMGMPKRGTSHKTAPQL